MATMMLPWCVTIIPRYFIIKEIGWLNSYKALILPAMFSGFGIFMMKQNMESLPNEFLEAARIDGANEFFIKIEAEINSLLRSEFVFEGMDLGE
jgi:multiple sugar transport system permease protein/raffinose/stachyose/melibiose transport system permease protein